MVPVLILLIKMMKRHYVKLIKMVMKRFVHYLMDHGAKMTIENDDEVITAHS